MEMQNEPHEERCGARGRLGGACRRWPLAGRSRCALHGGRSTGPRSAGGKIRSSRNALKTGLHARGFKQAMRESRSLLCDFRTLIG